MIDIKENIINKKWVIIGAGPAGMAVIGKLLDKGINSKDIGWIDPEFSVGDIGLKWRTVSSNTTVKLFIKFLNDCESFNYKDCPIDFKLNHLSPPSTCQLNEIADPLQWVSDQLKKKVETFQTMAKSIKREKEDNNSRWVIETSIGLNIISNNIVLAIGSEPLSLPLSGPSVITVEQTVNMEELKKEVNKDEDTVAVFGSSHTAIIALYNLTNLGIKIINFYRSPLKYAEYKDDWILYDNTGLKGYSAEWAKENIEKNPVANLERVQVDTPEFNEKFKQCNKVIYAVGFETRKSIKFQPETEDFTYNSSNGIIKKGLFGIGIGFPQFKADRVGNLEYNVGLWKFMVYLNETLPTWFNQSN